LQTLVQFPANELVVTTVLHGLPMVSACSCCTAAVRTVSYSTVLQASWQSSRSIGSEYEIPHMFWLRAFHSGASPPGQARLLWA
jgi:hypothetical protein